jgi:proteic killer suppression protein
MIRSFRHKRLESLFLTAKTKRVRADHVSRLRLILARLHASETPGDMALPGLGLHPLKGDMKGYSAVSVSGNRRVVFRFEAKDAYDVDYMDYH